MLPFYTPWKHQKTFDFQVFAEDIIMNIGQITDKERRLV